MENLDKLLGVAKDAADAYCYTQNNMVLVTVAGGAAGIFIWIILGRLFGVKG